MQLQQSGEESIEEFYEQLNAAKRQCKSQEVVIVMGDLNAKVGRGRQDEIVGPFGLGERNERGDRWVDWCIENDQTITNTWYRHLPIHLWT